MGKTAVPFETSLYLAFNIKHLNVILLCVFTAITGSTNRPSW